MNMEKMTSNRTSARSKLIFDRDARFWISASASLLVVLFLVLTLIVALGPQMGLDVDGFDQGIMKAAAEARSDDFTKGMTFTTEFGSARLLTAFCIAAGLLLLAVKNWRATLYISAASVTAVTAVTLLKTWIGRARPDIAGRLVEAGGHSYPSGHSIGAAAVYTSFAVVLCHYIHRPWKRALILALSFFMVMLVGLSRIYLGVHYATDVLGGVCLGTALALYFSLMIPRRKPTDAAN